MHDEVSPTVSRATRQNNMPSVKGRLSNQYKKTAGRVVIIGLPAEVTRDFRLWKLQRPNQRRA